MKKIFSLIIISAAFFGLTITSLCLLPNNAKGEPITHPSQLSPNPTIIDFEQFTAGYPYTPENNPLVIGDVTFSTEGSLYIRDITEDDANGTEVESKLLDIEPDYMHLMITFLNPVSEVLLGWWDPNYPGNFLRAYDVNNQLLEEVELTDLGPPHGVHATWIGFKRPSADISRLEVDPAIEPPYDNYGIDNIRYNTTPVPEPSTITVVSSVGDSVSDSPTGPFVPATTAYLAGWQDLPRDDGGLDIYARIKDAYWIWMDDFLGDMDNPLYFSKTFLIPESAIDIIGTMEITADNYFVFSVNGVNYGGAYPPDSAYQWNHTHPYSITNLVPGDNNLFITAWEFEKYTPSGLIYKLTISYNLLVEVSVPIDIKPQSCPNPINLKSQGVLPVAILGTIGFDVSKIDPSSIRLKGVAPIWWSYEDVATPFEPYTGKGNCYSDCTYAGLDGYMDLTLKFDIQAIIAAIGEVNDKDCVVFEVTGNLKEQFGSIPIKGEDVVHVIKQDKK